MEILLLALLCMPTAIIPLIVGIHLIRRGADNPFAQFAGLLTLKPLLATPLWVMSASTLRYGETNGLPLTLLPGAGLTLFLMLLYHTLLFGEDAVRAAWWLIVLDCVRWLNSFAMLIMGGAYIRIPSEFLGTNCILVVAALLLPTIFAWVANTLADNQSIKMKRKNDDL